MAAKAAPSGLGVRILRGACDIWLAYYCVKIVLMDQWLKWPPPKPSDNYARVAEFSDKISKGKEFSSRDEELAFKALYLRDAHQMLKDICWD